MFLSSGRPLGRVRPSGRKNLRGLGTVSTQVGNSLVYSSNPVASAPGSNLRRPIIITRPIPVRVQPVPVRVQQQPQPPVRVGTSLATAQALLQSNPSLLTQSQWTQLQQAGLVASTVPYSSASQIPSTSSAIDPATGVPYSTELAAAQAGATAATATTGTDIGTMLSTPYLGLPLYLWLGIGVGGYFLMSKRGR